MGGLIKKNIHSQQIHSMLTDAKQLAEVHADTEVPETVIDWINELKVLKGLPFNYLIPSEEYLPKESIRFFQMDMNWIDALVEGAFSIGSSTAGDQAHDQATYPKVSASKAEVVSGFVLRSEVVRGWPHLGFLAFDEQGNLMENVIRSEPLSQNVYLYMVSGPTAIDHVDIHEHPKGLHFGVDMDGKKALRYVNVPPDAPVGSEPGDQMSNANAGTVPLRPGTKRVVQISQLASNIEAALKGADAISGPFTTAEFALEMIEGVQAVRFCVEGSTTCDKLD